MSATQALKNVLAKMVEIELDVKRTLCFDFNAVALVEEKTGKNMLNGEVFNKCNGATLSIVLWAGLLLKHPELTLEAVRGLMHGGNIAEIADKVKAAWFGNAPEPAANPTIAPAEPTTAQSKSEEHAPAITE